MNKKFTLGSLLIFLLSTHTFSQTWEVYDTQLQLQSRLLYDDIELLSETVRIGRKEDELSLLSGDLKPAVSLIGTEVYQYLQPWILVKGPNGIGAFHEYGQQVLPLEYDDIQTYFNLLLARRGDEYFLFQRGKNKTTKLGKLDEAKITNTGMVIVKKGNEYSLPLAEDPQKIYELLADNSGEFVLAKEPSGYGLINREGNYVLDPVIKTLMHTSGNFYYGYDENQYLLIEGNDIKANIRYNSFHKITYEDNLMLEYIHGKLRRVMEEDGILLDAVGMVEVRRIGKNLYNVLFRDDKVGLLGKKGWLVEPMLGVDEINFGTEGLFPAKSKGMIGFVNPSGNWVIDPKYTATTLFSDQIAGVKGAQRWGLINNEGQVLSQPNWDEVKPFSKGLAIAKSNDKFFLLNTFGSIVNEEGFDNISRTEDGYFLIEKSGKTGLLDSEGKEVIPADFQSIRREKKDFVIVEKDGKTGVIKENGEVVLPIAYEDVLVDWANEQIFTKNLYEPVLIQVGEEPVKKRKRGE